MCTENMLKHFMNATNEMDIYVRNRTHFVKQNTYVQTLEKKQHSKKYVI